MSRCRRGCGRAGYKHVRTAKTITLLCSKWERDCVGARRDCGRGATRVQGRVPGALAHRGLAFIPVLPQNIFRRAVFVKARASLWKTLCSLSGHRQTLAVHRRLGRAAFSAHRNSSRALSRQHRGYATQPHWPPRVRFFQFPGL